MDMLVTAIDWDAVLRSKVDLREVVEFAVHYPALGTHKCSVCGELSDHSVITKHYWANRPLGQLMTRCPRHQAYWEANHPRSGQRRIVDVAPADRTAEEHAWMGTP